MDLHDFSYLTPYGYQSGSCGYCKDEHSSGSYYAHSTRLSVEHYQQLVDRGWRRSGKTLYKPDGQRSCCPHYTIRLPAAELKASRHQRKALHQWTRHVLGPDYHAALARQRPAQTRADKRAARTNPAFDLLAAVHDCEADRLPPPPAPAPAHRYEVSLEHDAFTEEKYALFEQYQRLVHHEPPSRISRKGFRDFLCDSPLARTPAGLGSFHQLHRVDGALVALSVLDLLPHAVSAVYFIYRATPDPSAGGTDMAAFSPGRLSALREAALALERGLRFYYMGYYIHGCAKMRYKADLHPQLVLDPVSHDWDPLDGPDGVGAALDRRRFVSMSRLRSSRHGGANDGAVSHGGGSPSERRADDEEGAKAGHTRTNGHSGEPEQRERKGDEQREHEEEPIPYPDPSTAMHDAPSLFALNMPGVLTAAELRAQVDLDAVRAEVKQPKGRSVVVPLAMLQAWADGDVERGDTLKGAIAELAAAVGPDVAKGMVVKFT